MKTPSLLTRCSLAALLGACDGGIATPNDVPTSTDASADASGDAGQDSWSCLGRVAPVVPGGTSAAIAFIVRDFQTHAPMPGVLVKVCARVDTLCAAPQSMGTSAADGGVSLTAVVGATGFDGYFELTGGTGRSEVAPTRMVPNAPLPAGAQTFVFDAIPRPTFEALGGLLTARLDAVTGAITALAVDCQGQSVRGVAVSVSPPATGSQQFYFVGALPSGSATQTDDSGLFGYVNVSPGTYTLTATLMGPMARIGTVTFDVRPGFITDIVNVRPSP